MVYSDSGFEAMSHNYHKAIRNHLCRGKFKNARRPVLINNWEGTYFDFTGEKLFHMAEEAADMGVELFVMDDGWFGKRDSDTTVWETGMSTRKNWAVLFRNFPQKSMALA